VFLSASHRQALYYRGVLLEEMAELDRGIAKLQAALARQAGNRALSRHIRPTRADLSDALCRRRHLEDMLDALGGPQDRTQSRTQSRAAAGAAT